MSFFQWSTKDPLEINDYGIPEPISNVVKSPNILLVPLVAFDNKIEIELVMEEDFTIDILRS